MNEEKKKNKAIIFSNIGLTFMKMNDDDIAEEYLQKALKLVFKLFI